MSARILVVEDNERNRKLFRDLLDYHGYEVITAEDGAAGVRLAQAQRPALIIMDIQMPEMDGFAALRALKELPETRDIPVIALTSFAMAGDRGKILAAGFSDYISKPIDTRALPDILAGHLQAQRA